MTYESPEEEAQEREPPKKKRCVDKENAETDNASGKGNRKRKPLKQMRVC